MTVPRNIKQFTRLPVFGLAMLHFLQWAVAGDNWLEILTNAAQVRSLSYAEAAAQRPVLLRAVVTGDGKGGLVIQDASSGIFVVDDQVDDSWVQRGDLVEVKGVSGPGQFAPVVVANQITKLGTARMPEPGQATVDGLMNGVLDSQWVEVSGIVRACEEVRSYEFKMVLAIGGMRLPVQYFGPTNALGLPDAEVRLTGLCFYQFNENGQILNPLLTVPGEKYLVVEKPAPADPFSAPIRRAQNILQFSPTNIHRHRVCVQGMVLYQIPGQTLWLQDAGQGLRVESNLKQAVHAGDLVKVAGFPVSGECSPKLEDATFCVITTATNTPAPLNVTNTDQAIRHDAGLIRLHARLVELTGSPGNWILRLDWQGETLDAVLHQPSLLPGEWMPGSLMQLTGICCAIGANSGPVNGGPKTPTSFQLLLRSTADARILQNPPWWTPARIAMIFAIASAFSVLATAVIAWLARQRLRMQALRRRMAEAEFSAMFVERNRIAREIHDTLAQGLGAISMHLEMVKGQLGLAPDKVAKHLEIAHQTARQSLTEARESIWNMRSQVLENGDLATALRDILRQLTDGTPIVGHFTIIGNARRLSPVVENNLLRIGQEAFTNAVKHAQAKIITATLTFSDREVGLEVRDNGRGFDPTQGVTESHFGLRGLRERTAQMEGQLAINSSPGAGTQVCVNIPVFS